MTETALLAGGAGFLGLHLARALIERGWRVVIADDFSRGRRDAELAAVAGAGAELVEHDLTRELGGELAALRPRLVFHLAAMVGVRNVSERPEAVLRTNLRALQNVLDWSAKAEPRGFVFTSTSEVADGAVALGLAQPPVPEEVPFVCGDLTAPRASYAMSKACGEMLVRTTAARTGLQARIVRLFNVYGPRMGHAHVVPELISRILSGAPEIDVYGAEPTRAFCFVADAVEAMLALAELDDPGPLLVNVGNDREEIQIEELARRLLALAGREARLLAHPAPAGSPRRRCPDIARLRELTGFEPAVGLDEGLRLTLAHQAGARAGSA